MSRTPYEFLVRWDDAGVLKGAYVRFLYRTPREGRPDMVEEGLAEPVDIADFPTGDVMDMVTRDALARVATLETEKETMQAQIEGLLAQIDVLTAG